MFFLYREEERFREAVKNFQRHRGSNEEVLSLKFHPPSWTPSASTRKPVPDVVCHRVYTQRLLCQSLHHMVMWETLFTHLYTKRRRPPPSNYTGTNTMQSFCAELWNIFENPSVVFLRPLILVLFYFPVVTLKLYRYWAQSQKSWVPLLGVPFISCGTLGESLFFSSCHW